MLFKWITSVTFFRYSTGGLINMLGALVLKDMAAAMGQYRNQTLPLISYGFQWDFLLNS